MQFQPMKRIILLTAFIGFLIPMTMVSGLEEPPPLPGTPLDGDPREITLEVDGVSLTLKTPYFPDQSIVLPDADDPLQLVNIVEKEPIFKSLTINAIPYGSGNSAEIFTSVEADQVDLYREALSEHRKNQGATPEEGPSATFFGQDTTSIMSTVFLNIDIFDPKPVQIIEWLFEAGERLWIVRVSQEIQIIEHLTGESLSDVPGFDDLVVGISISSDNIDAPSSSSEVRDLSAPRPPAASDISESDLPFPHWWDGDCDKNTYYSDGLNR